MFIIIRLFSLISAGSHTHACGTLPNSIQIQTSALLDMNNNIHIIIFPLDQPTTETDIIFSTVYIKSLSGTQHKWCCRSNSRNNKKQLCTSGWSVTVTKMPQKWLFMPEYWCNLIVRLTAIVRKTSAANTNNSKGSWELSFTTPIGLERCCCCCELYETLKSGEADMNNSQQTAMTPEL